MIVSPVQMTSPEWNRQRALMVPSWLIESEPSEERSRRRRGRRRGADQFDLSPQLQHLLVEEALDRLWKEIALPPTPPSLDWGRAALGALLGSQLAGAVREADRRSQHHFLPRTYADFSSLVEAFSLH
ncbi:hypothetical protein DYH09_07610 [bacterium CPR1]|nr:hypothetical protein [bacterium CPR1]